MTLADPPPPGYGIFHKYFFFFEPFPQRYIVYVYVYQKEVVYAHVRKVKFPKTIRHTSE